MVEDNEDAWELWCSIQMLWREDGFSGRLLGLDIPAVLAVADRVEIDVDRVTLAKVNALTRAVLDGTDKNGLRDRTADYCRMCRETKRNANCADCELPCQTAKSK